jgi:hypothetical protein
MQTETDFINQQIAALQTRSAPITKPARAPD